MYCKIGLGNSFPQFITLPYTAQLHLASSCWYSVQIQVFRIFVPIVQAFPLLNRAYSNFGDAKIIHGLNWEILGNDQLDTQLLYFSIRLLWSSICFEYYMLIIRRLNCIDAASGVVTVSKWPSGSQYMSENLYDEFYEVLEPFYNLMYWRYVITYVYEAEMENELSTKHAKNWS